jgi:5-(hydroxymethyl)furfural/furfural oxidase
MHPEMQKISSNPFPAAYSDRVRALGVVCTKNKIITGIAGALLDGPAVVRNYLFDNVIVEGYKFNQVMQDDEALEAFVRKATIGVWHASCTCRMGADSDPMAVTDTQGRVRGGIAGLRVVDASIFPMVPSANTNFPTLMSAEKIADAILAA